MFILKIAWRSILRHKAKSIIIGTILFLGALIMTLGNATAIGMQRGVEENMVKSFTGHIIIVSNEEQKDNVLFTPLGKPLKILKDYDKIKYVLEKQDFIKGFVPMTRGLVAVLGGQEMDGMLTFGCNFDEFQKVFGNPVTAIEGSVLTGNDHGLLLNVNGRKNRYKIGGYWLIPQGTDLNSENLSPEAKAESWKLDVKDSLALEGFGEVNSTNKELPVKGVVRFRSLNSLMQEVTFMDIESYRELFGYYTAHDVVTLPAAQTALLNAGEDALFDASDIYSAGTTGTTVAELEKRITTQPTVTRTIDFDTAAYNYVSILLKDGQNLNAAVARMKQIATDNDLPVRVLSWKTASGQVAQISDILQIIITVFVVLLFFVAIIIIMNTLSMNALERTEEFGMMRAVGARKGIITRMFLAETFILSFFFGGTGIFIGVSGTLVIRPLRISAGGTEIAELLFGGEVFQPILGGAGLITGIVGLAIVTVLAVIYPVLVARKITPLDAINRH